MNRVHSLAYVAIALLLVSGACWYVHRRFSGSNATLRVLERDTREFVDHLHETYPHDERVRALKTGTSNTRFQSLSLWHEDVGYSIDKGKILAVCTSDGPTNEAIFVILHELAHIATEEWGHTDAFWENFAFLLDEAEAYGWYRRVDYEQTPGTICGTAIRHQPERGDS